MSMTAALETLREVAGDGQLIVVFQPYRVYRTRDLQTEIAAALAIADEAVILEVFGPGEVREPGEGGVALTAAVDLPSRHKVFVPSWDDVPREVVRRARRGDVVVTMGAPPISLMGDQLLGGRSPTAPRVARRRVVRAATRRRRTRAPARPASRPTYDRMPPSRRRSRAPAAPAVAAGPRDVRHAAIPASVRRFNERARARRVAPRPAVADRGRCSALVAGRRLGRVRLVGARCRARRGGRRRLRRRPRGSPDGRRRSGRRRRWPRCDLGAVAARVERPGGVAQRHVCAGDWPRTVVITVTLRQPVAAVPSGASDGYVLVDASGVLFRTARRRRPTVDRPGVVAVDLADAGSGRSEHRGGAARSWWRCRPDLRDQRGPDRGAVADRESSSC